MKTLSQKQDARSAVNACSRVYVVRRMMQYASIHHFEFLSSTLSLFLSNNFT